MRSQELEEIEVNLEAQAAAAEQGDDSYDYHNSSHNTMRNNSTNSDYMSSTPSLSASNTTNTTNTATSTTSTSTSSQQQAMREREKVTRDEVTKQRLILLVSSLQNSARYYHSNITTTEP